MFPDWRGNEIDFTHPFVISYENKIGKQIELDTHMGKFCFTKWRFWNGLRLRKGPKLDRLTLPESAFWSLSILWVICSFAIYPLLIIVVPYNFFSDDAEITLNVCIGGDFEGNDVYYEGVRDNPHKKHVTLTNRIGFGVFHPGQNAHGATKISKGKVCL